MLEIFGFIIAIGGIATLARGRGASATKASIVAIVGYVFIRLIGLAVARSQGTGLVFVLIAWVWLGCEAAYLRFILGAGRRKPDGTWSCPNCSYTNHPSSVVCEACSEPYRPRDEAATQP